MISSSSLKWEETQMSFRDVEAEGGEGERFDREEFFVLFLNLI